MGITFRFLRTFVLFAFVFLSLADVVADTTTTIILKDGKKIEGQIVSENEKEIAIKARSGSITFTRKILRSQIERIEEGLGKTDSKESGSARGTSQPHRSAKEKSENDSIAGKDEQRGWVKERQCRKCKGSGRVIEGYKEGLAQVGYATPQNSPIRQAGPVFRRVRKPVYKSCPLCRGKGVRRKVIPVSTLLLKDGTKLKGHIAIRSNDVLILKLAGGETRRIRRSEVERITDATDEPQAQTVEVDADAPVKGKSATTDGKTDRRLPKENKSGSASPAKDARIITKSVLREGGLSARFLTAASLNDLSLLGSKPFRCTLTQKGRDVYEGAPWAPAGYADVCLHIDKLGWEDQWKSFTVSGYLDAMLVEASGNQPSGHIVTFTFPLDISKRDQDVLKKSFDGGSLIITLDWIPERAGYDDRNPRIQNAAYLGKVLYGKAIAGWPAGQRRKTRVIEFRG